MGLYAWMDTMRNDNGEIFQDGVTHTETAGGRPTWTLTLPSGWARAFLAGIEAALLSWAVPALLAAVLFLVDAGNPWLKDHMITESGQVGTQLWALTLGAAATFGETTMTLVPLTWTIAQVLILRALMIRGRNFAPASQWAAVPAFALTALIIILSAGQGLSWSSIFPGALLIPLAAAAWAVVNQSSWKGTWVASNPWLAAGARMGGLWVALAVSVGLVTLVVDIVVNWEGIIAESSLLTAGESPLPPALLVLTFYFFTFAAWALAWVAGPGFVADGGQICSPTETSEPLLTAIPVGPLVPTTSPGNLVVLILVGLGFFLGILGAMKLAALPFRQVALQTGVAALLFAAASFVYLSLSVGSLGALRLAHLGPVPSASALLSLEVAGIASALILLLHPAVLAAVRKGFGQVAQGASTGTPDKEVSAKGASVQSQPGEQGWESPLDESEASSVR